MRLILLHNDLDGISGLLLAQMYLKDRTENIYKVVDYKEIYIGDEFDRSWYADYAYCDFKQVIISDVAVNQSMFEWVTETFGDNYVICDHHERSLWLQGKPNCFISDTSCGTKLFYEYLRTQNKMRTPAIIRDFVELVDVYDRYDDSVTPDLWSKAHDLNRVFWASIGMYKQGLDKYYFFIKNQMEKFEVSPPSFEFNEFENNMIVRALENEEKEFTKADTSKLIYVDDKGKKCLVWGGRSKISIVCYRLLFKYPEIDYVLNINTYKEKGQSDISGKISARARKDSDFDVTQLMYVEGHKAAGGAVLEPEVAKALWNGTYKLPYKV